MSLFHKKRLHEYFMAFPMGLQVSGLHTFTKHNLLLSGLRNGIFLPGCIAFIVSIDVKNNMAQVAAS